MTIELFIRYFFDFFLTLNEHLHHLSFNMPLLGAEMNGMEQLLCAFSTRKGVS